jgi:hypothetical protein
MNASITDLSTFEFDFLFFFLESDQSKLNVEAIDVIKQKCRLVFLKKMLGW